MATTAERLGYPADAKLVIVNGDDIGMCHAANVGTARAFREGILTAASLMVPCPWALEAIELMADLDVGVHLTLTAEWQTYRWGPITAVGRARESGLVDPEGYFWHREAPVHQHGDTTAARVEVQAQIEWALARGLDATKLDGHMAVFSTDPAYLKVYIDLARQYRLPLRLRSADFHRERGQTVLADLIDAARQDLLAPDHRAGISLQNPEALEAQTVAAIHQIKPGVTELVLHASAPGDEITAIAPDAAARVEALRLVTESQPVRQALASEGIQPIAWRALRDAQRSGA